MKFAPVIILAVSGLTTGFAQPVQDLEFWLERTRQIQVGMRREDVERILPPYVPPEGGSTVRSGFTSEEQGISYAVAPRYTLLVSYDYAGVPRDTQGKVLGRYSPDNRLLKPVKLRPTGLHELRQVMLAELDAALAAKNVTAITDVRLEIEAIPPRTDVEKSSREVRDAKLRLWLSSLQRVDAVHDRSFDPNDFPMVNIAPPRGTGGEIYDSGISPNSIKDPVVREEYKRVLAANAAKAERLNTQRPLYNLRGDWLRTIQSFRKDQYDDGAEDTEAIALIIETEIKNAALKKEVTELLAAKK